MRLGIALVCTAISGLLIGEIIQRFMTAQPHRENLRQFWSAKLLGAATIASGLLLVVSLTLRPE